WTELFRLAEIETTAPSEDGMRCRHSGQRELHAKGHADWCRRRSPEDITKVVNQLTIRNRTLVCQVNCPRLTCIEKSNEEGTGGLHAFEAYGLIAVGKLTHRWRALNSPSETQ